LRSHKNPTITHTGFVSAAELPSSCANVLMNYEQEVGQEMKIRGRL
jgi:hypothetical protein